MCVAVPGKIISIEGRTAKTDFNGSVINTDISLLKAKVGDYILVHSGCGLEVLTLDKANEILSILKELEDL